MKTYVISYFFDGNGEVKIKANSEEEAKEKFFEGNFRDEEEWWGENRNIADIQEEIKSK